MNDIGEVFQQMSDAAKQPTDVTALADELLAFFNFINEPPQYEDKRMVRDYRHELARHWMPLHDKINAALRATTQPAVTTGAEPVVKLKRIPQRGANDCGIAALATACRVSYETILPLLEKGSGDGINEPDMYDWLATNGWAWQIVYQNNRTAGKYHKRDPWPPKPFAPTHIVMVTATQGWHFTVMDSKGEVFDPWTPERKSLADADYQEISWVMGIWKVRPLYALPAANTEGDTFRFFSQNVDAWGALEWFDRLAKALRQQDAAVVAGNMLEMETCRNVAASSSMRLVREYEREVRAALSTPTPATDHEKWLRREAILDEKFRTPTPAPAATGDVRCVGCGSNWTSGDLAAAKVADPKIISCCPERQPLDITGWMARAISMEEKLRQALSRPHRNTPTS